MVTTALDVLHNQSPSGYCEGSTFSNSYYENDEIVIAMIEFAKLHVQEALKQASEKVEMITDENQDFRLQSCNCIDYVLDTKSILNAYPLENIK